jgi:hypothetical protein
MNHEISAWNPKQESLRSWMVKIEAYRNWYSSLEPVDRVMLKIEGLPANCRIPANIAVQELISLVGQDRANQMMGLVKKETK